MSRIEDDRCRVLVIGADDVTASFTRQALQCSDRFVWCGWATTAAAARRLLDDLAPDAVVTDVFLPGPGGAEIVAEVVASRPEVPVIVLTHRSDPAPLRAALRAGVHGYVVYGDGLAELVTGLSRAVEGRLHFSDSALELLASELGRPEGTRVPQAREARSIVASASLQAAATLTDADTPLPADDVVEELTPREIQVVSELALGLDNQAIGRRLGISDGTVSTYVRRIREKLGARNRGELMAMSARLTASAVAS